VSLRNKLETLGRAGTPIPVGLVGAAESKEALISSPLPAVANHGRKGGSAVAAAAVNALIYYYEE